MTFPHRLPTLILTMLVALLLGQPAFAAGDNKFAAVTVDARTGRVLFDSNSNALRHPASLTKMMTLYIMFEELKTGRLKLSTPLRTSARAARMAPSKMGLRAGSSITVEQAIYALVIKSANDVAAVVAENIGGSELAFARRMTKTARAMGMAHTTYRNASGLPNPLQVTTARDQATLGLRLMRDFPQYYPYFRATRFTFNGRLIRGHNRLVGRFPGTDGIKTGYINASGYNLVTSTKRGSKRLVGVVLGGRSATSRNTYMMTMLTRAFSKAADGRTIAATAGSAKGAVDPLKQLIGKATAEGQSTAQSLNAQDKAALAEVAGAAAAITAEEPEDGGETSGPTVIAAELDKGSNQPVAVVTGGTEHGVAVIQPPAKLPFQTKKLASQADVDLATGTTTSLQAWTVEIGDFKTRKSAAAIVARLKKTDTAKLANKDSKTIQVKRNGATLYRLLVSGYDEVAAKASCAQVAKLGKDCAVISPNG